MTAGIVVYERGGSSLEGKWTHEDTPNRLDDAIGAMQRMRTAALQLVGLPIDGGMNAGPTFSYVEE